MAWYGIVCCGMILDFDIIFFQKGKFSATGRNMGERQCIRDRTQGVKNQKICYGTARYGTVRQLTYKTSSWAPVALKLPSINLTSVCLSVVHVFPYTNDTLGTRVLRSRTPHPEESTHSCYLPSEAGAVRKKTPPKVSVCPPKTVTMTNSDWAPGDLNTDD